MRAIEFINEGSKPIRRSAKAAIPNMQMFPQLDNGNVYSSYRYGVALAGSPEESNVDQESVTNSKMVTIAYSDGDAEIINKANKKMGINARAVTDKTSHESATVETSSPVAKPKRNKYGV